MTVRFDHSEDVAANIKTFWFKPEQPVSFIAGQYIQLHLPHKGMDERGDKRWFSLSSSPTEPLLSITTKLAPKSSTFKQTLQALKPGQEVTMAPPVGFFVLPEDPNIPLAFIAGGIGVTPMRSMVKWLADMGEKRTIQLIYAVNRIEELAFRDIFESYGVELIPVVREPAPSWKGETSVLDAGRIERLLDAPAGSLAKKYIYLSGPEPMIEVLASGLKERGIEKSYIKTDFFPGYTEI